MPMNVQYINVNLIDEPAWNSRVTNDPTQDAALAASISKEGVLEPIKVREIAKVGSSTVQRYILIFGTRRLKAVRSLSKPQDTATTIPAIVEPLRPDNDTSVVATAMLENAVENLQRKDLSLYETARALSALRDAKFKIDDIVAKVGLSKGHVSTLVSIYTTVDPTILTEWAKSNRDRETDEHHVPLTLGFLRSLLKFEDKAVQRKMYAEMLENYRPSSGADDIDAAEAEESEEETEEGERKKVEKKYSVTAKRYNSLIRTLRNKKAPTLAVAVAKYLVGLTDEIPQYIDAPDEE